MLNVRLKGASDLTIGLISDPVDVDVVVDVAAVEEADVVLPSPDVVRAWPGLT